MTDPANKTVLITGAGGGFGRHMARQFRAARAKLILTDVTDKALDGLFLMLAEEEKKIRQDPAARVTDLLKKVFAEK